MEAITCPNCGNEGSAGEGEAFSELERPRGWEHDLNRIFKCRRVVAGFEVGCGHIFSPKERV